MVNFLCRDRLWHQELCWPFLLGEGDKELTSGPKGAANISSPSQAVPMHLPHSRMAWRASWEQPKTTSHSLTLTWTRWPHLILMASLWASNFCTLSLISNPQSSIFASARPPPFPLFYEASELHGEFRWPKELLTWYWLHIIQNVKIRYICRYVSARPTSPYPSESGEKISTSLTHSSTLLNFEHCTWRPASPSRDGGKTADWHQTKASEPWTEVQQSIFWKAGQALISSRYLLFYSHIQSLKARQQSMTMALEWASCL